MPLNEARFWKNARRGKEDECWLWSKRVSHLGYGLVDWYEGDEQVRGLVHRVAYQLGVGPLPPFAKLFHTCENKTCCNPKHLYVVRGRRKKRGKGVVTREHAT